MAWIHGYSVVILTVFLGLVLCEENQHQKLEMKLSPAGTLKKGDTLNITCSILEFKAFEIVRFIRVIKNPEDDKDEEETVELATNAHVMDGFADTGRYEVLADYDNGKFVLTIKDAQGVDGGSMGCQYLGKDSSKKKFITTALEYITIYVPLDTVEIRSKDSNGEWIKVEDGAQVVMRDGHEDGLECYTETTGSDIDIRPKLNFMIGELNATKYKHVQRDTEADQSIDNKQLSRSFRSFYKWETDSPDKSFDGRVITCTGSIEKYDAITTTATLSIQYAPDVQCRKTTYAKLGEENVRVTCEASMSPAPTASFWTFNQTMINTGDKTTGFSTEQKELDQNKWEFSLVVNKVDASTLQKYKFSVDNGLAEPVVREAVLEEVEETPEPEIPSTTPLPQTKPQTETQQPSDPQMNEVIGASSSGCCGLFTTSVPMLLLIALMSVVMAPRHS